MKILQINTFGNLSTGRIAVDLFKTIVENGYMGKVAFARNSIAENVPYIKIGTNLDVKFHALMTRITDKTGFYSTTATNQLIRQIKEYDPDIIHLHNLHGYYINIDLLFKYLKESQKPVVWTIHDCWPFTGHCCYFNMASCDRWKTGCYDCVQRGSYPASKFIDNCTWNYRRKKELFSGINMKLVAVSEWLACIIKESFLGNYPLEVIYNGIDTNVFQPTESNFRAKYNLYNKFIVLGVASTWDTRKGLKDFIKLSRMLDEQYKVVVVGVTEKEKAILPENMIGISRTDSVYELAGLYSTSDVFFNASVEETFGLPTIEAIACGTPAIVYNATALPEVIDDKCGVIVEKHDLNEVVNVIERIKSGDLTFNLSPSYNFKFEKKLQYQKYINLYRRILKD